MVWYCNTLHRCESYVTTHVTVQWFSTLSRRKQKHTSLYLPSSRQVQTKSNAHWIIFINFLNILCTPYCYWVRSEVLTAVSVNTAVSWNMMPCSLMQGHWCFRVTSCLHHLGNSKFLWNASTILLGYMASHPRRQHSWHYYSLLFK